MAYFDDKQYSHSSYDEFDYIWSNKYSFMQELIAYKNIRWQTKSNTQKYCFIDRKLNNAHTMNVNIKRECPVKKHEANIKREWPVKKHEDNIKREWPVKKHEANIKREWPVKKHEANIKREWPLKNYEARLQGSIWRQEWHAKKYLVVGDDRVQEVEELTPPGLIPSASYYWKEEVCMSDILIMADVALSTKPDTDVLVLVGLHYDFSTLTNVNPLNADHERFLIPNQYELPFLVYDLIKKLLEWRETYPTLQVIVTTPLVPNFHQFNKPREKTVMHTRYYHQYKKHVDDFLDEWQMFVKVPPFSLNFLFCRLNENVKSSVNYSFKLFNFFTKDGVHFIESSVYKFWIKLTEHARFQSESYGPKYDIDVQNFRLFWDEFKKDSLEQFEVESKVKNEHHIERNLPDCNSRLTLVEDKLQSICSSYCLTNIKQEKSVNVTLEQNCNSSSSMIKKKIKQKFNPEIKQEHPMTKAQTFKWTQRRTRKELCQNSSNKDSSIQSVSYIKSEPGLASRQSNNELVSIKIWNIADTIPMDFFTTLFQTIYSKAIVDKCEDYFTVKLPEHIAWLVVKSFNDCLIGDTVIKVAFQVKKEITPELTQEQEKSMTTLINEVYLEFKPQIIQNMKEKILKETSLENDRPRCRSRSSSSGSRSRSHKDMSWSSSKSHRIRSKSRSMSHRKRSTSRYQGRPRAQSHHRSRSRSRSHQKRSRSRSHQRKSGWRSHSYQNKSRSRSQSHQRRSRLRSHQKRSRSRSQSHQRSRRSRSQSQRSSMSRSPSLQRKSRSRSQSHQRRSRSRSQSHQRRSRSRSQSHQKRSRSRSQSHQRKSRSRSQSRQRRSRSRSQSHQRRSRFKLGSLQRSRSPLHAHKRRSRSRARSRSLDKRSDVLKLPKKYMEMTSNSEPDMRGAFQTFSFSELYSEKKNKKRRKIKKEKLDCNYFTISGFTASKSTGAKDVKLVSMKRTLSLFGNLSDKLGVLGPAFKSVVNSAIELGANGFSVFKNEDNLNLLQLVEDKMKSLQMTASPELQIDLIIALDEIKQLLQYATLSQIYNMDLNTVAKESVGRDSGFILNRIKNDLENKGIKSIDNKILNDLYIKVCDLHFKMVT